jgi:CRISPR-associated endonuclease/helicase Cas3
LLNKECRDLKAIGGSMSQQAGSVARSAERSPGEAYIAHTRDSDDDTHGVREHLLDTARLAREFANAFACGDFAYVTALCHDLGKYSERFQAKLNNQKISVDHSTAGAQFLYGNNGNSMAMLAAYCIAGHHGGLPNGGHQDDNSDEKTLYGRLKKRVEDYSAHENDDLDIPALKPPPLQIRDGFAASFFVRFIFSCLVDADWLDTEAFMDARRSAGRRADDIESIPDLYDKLCAYVLENLNNNNAGANFGANSLINRKRTELREDCLNAAERERGLFTLTAPTGSGKTIASLSFALKHAAKRGHQRIIYVVPYNTIIEQNANVFEGILGRENVLQHHSGINYESSEDSAESESREESLESKYRKLLATENWDAPLIVTSNVQFFESLFASNTSACRKLHNIASSVIIFDEAQMLPLPYLLPCTRAVRELVSNYRCSAVLATATQSSLDEYFKPLGIVEIAKNPSETYEMFRRVTFIPVGGILTEDALAERLMGHRQALCVVNARKLAQTIAEKLDAACSDGGVFHLSTTMYPAHRRRVLKDIRERLADGRPCRVVSTSMIEAGVDVDFPVLYREAAGLDSVIQASGRCNREGKRARGDSFVYIFETEKKPKGDMSRNVSAFSYAADNYAKDNFDDIATLDAIRCYFEQLRYIIQKDGLDTKSVVGKFNHGARACSFPFREVSSEFNIIESGTRDILIPIEEAAADIADRLRQGERSRELFRSMQQYSVPLYESDARDLPLEELDDGKIKILSCPKEYYNELRGIELGSSGGKAFIV